MFSNSWQQPGGHAPTHTHNDRTDIRDRVKAYSMVEDAANSQPATASATLSPTSAFFDPPSRFPNQHGTIFRVPKRRYPQQEAEKPRKRQQQLQPPPQRDCLDDIQPKGSPLAENLISQVKAESTALYSCALKSMSTTHGTLDQILTDTAAENDRVLASVDSDHRKIVKSISEMMIHDDESGQSARVEDSVATFKADIDVLEAEVRSLWDQWQAAEKDIAQVFAELTGKEKSNHGGNHEGGAGSATAVRESLVREIRNFEEDLDGVLEDSHENLRTMEKNMSKKINGIVKSLVQQSMLE